MGSTGYGKIEQIKVKTSLRVQQKLLGIGEFSEMRGKVAWDQEEEQDPEVGEKVIHFQISRKE